jgi:hypothetical protein
MILAAPTRRIMRPPLVVRPLRHTSLSQCDLATLPLSFFGVQDLDVQATHQFRHEIEDPTNYGHDD